MPFPIRCFSCGKVINHLWTKYEELIKTKHARVVLDLLKVPKSCCRRMFISHVDIDDILLMYNRPIEERITAHEKLREIKPISKKKGVYNADEINYEEATTPKKKKVKFTGISHHKKTKVKEFDPNANEYEDSDPDDVAR